MPVEYLKVGVVVERRSSASPWADHGWVPVAVLPDAPDLPPWTSLGKGPDRERFYLGPAEIALFGVDTAYFRDNFLMGAPQLWVALRQTGATPEIELVGVTADPNEGEAYTQTVDDIVEALPMPAEIAARVAAFFEAHHVEREFVKRKRDRKRPDDERRGPPGLRSGGMDRNS